MSLRVLTGRVLFFLLWPAFFVYFYHTERTRVLLVRQGKVLVIKHWLSDGRWSLPGGGVLPEEDPKVGAAREVREETGLQIEPDTLTELGTGVWRAYGLRYRYRSYAVILHGEVPLQPRYLMASRLERFYLVWKRPNELALRKTNPDVVNSIAMLQKSHPEFLVQ